jgi:hypothetical protein
VWEDDDGDDDNEAVLQWMDDDAPVWVGKGTSKIGRSVVSTLYPYRTGFTDTTYMDKQQDRRAGAKILGNGLR